MRDYSELFKVIIIPTIIAFALIVAVFHDLSIAGF